MHSSAFRPVLSSSAHQEVLMTSPSLLSQPHNNNNNHHPIGFRPGGGDHQGTNHHMILANGSNGMDAAAVAAAAAAAAVGGAIRQEGRGGIGIGRGRGSGGGGDDAMTHLMPPDLSSSSLAVDHLEKMQEKLKSSNSSRKKDQLEEEAHKKQAFVALLSQALHFTRSEDDFFAGGGGVSKGGDKKNKRARSAVTMSAVQVLHAAGLETLQQRKDQSMVVDEMERIWCLACHKPMVKDSWSIRVHLKRTRHIDKVAALRAANAEAPPTAILAGNDFVQKAGSGFS